MSITVIISIVAIVVTILIVVATHLGGTIWWMSKINTSLTFMTQAVADIKNRLEDHSKDFFLKRDADKQILKRDREMESVWKAINSIKK